MARICLLLLLIAFFGCTVAKGSLSFPVITSSYDTTTNPFFAINKITRVGPPEIPGFWSLDCGGEGFEAENDITWVSDEGFVRTGVIREGINGSLRVFTSKEIKKNCYTIPVGKGVKILVRLIFYYGNYDGLDSPPEMELIFDGYDWGSLQTSMEGGDWMEVIYVTKKYNTNICFGRTSSNQDPFAYSIEVRTLALNMYSDLDESKVLKWQTRDAFGANKSIQYPDDPYDRYWSPLSESFKVLRSDTNYTNTTNWQDDYPPPLLTRAAVELPFNGTSSQLPVNLWKLPSTPIPIYYNLYFSEMSNKTTYGSRAFDIFRDGIQKNEDPIIPPYQSLFQFYGFGVEASNSTTIEFVSTKNATLPPIISAMEVYSIADASNVTSEKDVTALGVLQESFPILQNWTGDPCVPVDYNWEWVVCNNDSTPRITELRLSGYGLSGSLPDFSDLTNLEIIDLHNNSLTGDIPAFLGSLPSLGTLNLSMNDFSSIPSTLTKNTLIKLDVTGNPKLCNPGVTCVGQSPPSPSSVPPPPPTNFGAIIGNRVTVRLILLQFVFFLVSMIFVVA